MKLTLPENSNERKGIPVWRGVLRYFPAALAGVARVSKKGNDKHNPGQEMHHARGKSMDHADCVIRHLMDLEDLLAACERGEDTAPGGNPAVQILEEVDQFAWRALALSQEIHERFEGVPLAPAARVPEPEVTGTEFDMQTATGTGLDRLGGLRSLNMDGKPLTDAEMREKILHPMHGGICPTLYCHKARGHEGPHENPHMRATTTIHSSDPAYRT